MSKIFKIGDVITPSRDEVESTLDITFGKGYTVTDLNLERDVVRFFDDVGDERSRTPSDYTLLNPTEGKIEGKIEADITIAKGSLTTIFKGSITDEQHKAILKILQGD